MFDQCLKILLIFGSFSVVVRGEGYDYYEVGYTTTTTTSRPTSTSMRTTSWPTTIRRSVGDNECYAGDPNCEWKNDPSENQTWNKRVYYSTGKELSTYWNYVGSSPLGNSSIRLISPIFRRDDNYGCVSVKYWSMLQGRSGLVGLRVYQKPVHIALTDLIAYSDDAKKDYILFEVWGDQGKYSNTKKFPLKHFDSNFQIILEGIFGELPVHLGIWPILWRTECTEYMPYTIPNRQTTSTTISITTTMLTTTTERSMRENDDTITDKVTKSDTWVDSRPASPQSNLWSTTTWPTTLPTTKQQTTTETLQEGNGDTITDKVTKSDTWVDSRSASPQSNLWSTTTWPTTLPTTKQQTTTETRQEGNGCDSRNPPIMLYLIAPGNSLIDFRVRPRCSAGADTYRLNDLRANIVDTSSHIDHEKQPSDARYSTKNDDVIDIRY